MADHFFGLAAAANLESRRCERAVAQGSPVDFWINRIRGALAHLDAARSILQSRIDWLEKAKAPK